MKRSRSLLVLYFVTIVTARFFAQEITYSPQETFPKGLVSIFLNSPNGFDKSETSGNYFVVTGSNWSFDLFQSPKKKSEKQIVPEISYYENNVIVNRSELILETRNGKASLIGMSALDNESIVFLGQTDEEYNRCYYQYYDKTCKSISDPILLSEKKLKDGFLGFFTCVVSENQQFICLQYVQLNTKEMSDREITFEIFDRNMKLVDQRDYSSLGIKRQDFLSGILLKNDGSLLIGVAAMRLNDKGKFTNELEKFKVHILRAGKVNYWECEIPYTKVSEVEMFLSEKNDQILYLAGMGSEGESNDSKVAFYVKYDLEKRIELSNVKNAINFETIMYQPQKIFDQDDGVVFITERVFGRASTTLSMNTGPASTTPKDYFNTVLCFKVEEGSKVVPWNTIIDKEQVFISSLSLSHFGSIKVVNSDENCFIFFNDNTANYNERGDYIATEKNIHKFDGKQEKKLWLDDKGLAMVNLNLMDGSTERRMIIRNKGIVNLLSDKCFVADPNGHSATFFIQKSELGQIGLIHF